jgi:hypothetical protein
MKHRKNKDKKLGRSGILVGSVFHPWPRAFAGEAGYAKSLLLTQV